MVRKLILLILVMLLAVPAFAETWLPLEKYVKLCVLIVKCETEVEGKNVKYKVDEEWKGKYSPDLFHNRPPDGYLYTNTWHGNENPVDGREVIVAFRFPSQVARPQPFDRCPAIQNGLRSSGL